MNIFKEIEKIFNNSAISKEIEGTKKEFLEFRNAAASFIKEGAELIQEVKELIRLLKEMKVIK